MANARWIQQMVPQVMLSLGGIGTGVPRPMMTHWAAVSDDDEILATVEGCDQRWTAQVQSQSGMPSKWALFISEGGAKARVEQWLSPHHTFPKASASTGWAAIP